MDNYYDILGISKSASDKEIRQTFRRLARKYHPDLNAGDRKAEENFKRINEAYEVLSDPETRKKYDRYGDKWKYADQIKSQSEADGGAPFSWTSRGGGQQDPFAGLEDLLGGFVDLSGRRGRRAAATRMESTIEVTLEEAFSGTKRMATITSPHGQRRIEVSIPPGVDNGSVVRVAPGEGKELVLNITVAPHKRFNREGNDLYTDVDVPLEDVVLGGEVDVQTLKKKVRLKVPEESQNGQRIRLAGQGMPGLGSTNTRGDLYVIIHPRMPRNMTDEERELFRKLKTLASLKR